MLSGLLLALSLPPFDAEWLGWFAGAPVFIAARGRRSLEAMGLGMPTGVACGVVHVRSLPDPPAMFACLPFLYLAMLLGVVTTLAEWARRKMPALLWTLFVGSVGVSVEWLTTFAPLPLNLALCVHRHLDEIQIADITGIWGVSFLVWFVSAAMANLVLSLVASSPQSKADAAAQRRRNSAVLLVVTLPIWRTLLLAYSLFSCKGVGWDDLNHSPLRVAAIQDFSDTETAHLTPPTSLATESVDRAAMTRRAAAKGAQLIVWSEGCLGASFAPDARINPTADLARALKVYLVVGYTQPAQPTSFNCAALVAPSGKTVGVHRKMHLFLGERQEVQAGRTVKAFRTRLGKVGMLICLDNCYTHVARQLVKDGAQIIAMPNFDPPTPRGVLHRLHAAVTPFRAVENRVPIVRCDSNGLSQIVDATGNIVKEGLLYAPAVLVADVALGDGQPTLFTRWGDWWAYLCLVFSMGAGGLLITCCWSQRR